MTVYLSPIGNDQVVAASTGIPLVGGYWNVFLAGTSTPVVTYVDSAGVTQQPTNIVLDAAGRPANPIWLSGGIPVKFRLFSASAVPLLTIDNVSGVNDPAGITAQDQWVLSGAAPTYISGTSFSLVGDQTGTFQIGRRVRTTNTGGTVYSSITNSVFGAVTTVTVSNDAGSLDSGLSAVSYGVISSVNSSMPGPSSMRMNTARMLGRTTAGVGAVEELTAAQVAAFTAAASDTAQGAVELATTAEVQTGTDTARAVTPAAMQAGKIVSIGQTSLSGSETIVSGIASWAKRVTILVDVASTSTTAIVSLRIGDAGGIEASGYSGVCSGGVTGSATSAQTSTTGFQLNITGLDLQTNTYTAKITLDLMDAASFKWVCSGTVFPNTGTASGYIMSGFKSTSAALDRISLVTSAGTFDGGSINVLYE